MRVETEPEFIARLDPPPDLILADYSLPHYDGLRAAKLLKEREIDVPFILVSGTIGEEAAVEAIKNGAADSLLKDRVARLGRAVDRVFEERRLRLEQRRSEEQIRLQAAALEAAANAVLIADRSGKILYVNPAFTTLSGYTAAEAIGQNPRLLKSGCHDPGFYRAFWDALVAGRVWRGRFINRRKDGSLFQDEHTVTCVRNPQGEISHYVAILHDVTQRELDAAALRASNERLARHATALDRLTHHYAAETTDLGAVLQQIAAVTASALDVRRLGIWRYGPRRQSIVCDELFDRQTSAHSSGSVLEASLHPACFRALADGHVIAASDARLDPRTAEFSADYLAPLGIVSMLDAPVHLQDGVGGVVSCEHCGEPRAWSSDEEVFVAAIANLVSLVFAQTERKSLQAQFLRSQRMESIGALAGGIAHDLNNALAPISMGAEVLRLSTSDPETVRILETIQQCATRGAGMVKQVLTFARGTEDDRSPVQLNHLVREMAGVARQTFPHSINVQTELSKELWTLLANPTQIHQVLLNLCVNARDAMPDGGTLTLATANIQIDTSYAASLSPDAAPGPYVVLSVADTGTGMAPDVLAKAFNAFFTTKDPGTGTGLGLSTAQAIVRSHKGFIALTSAPGKGTEFKIYLPAELTAQEASDAVQPVLPAGEGQWILVVDDESTIRNIAAQTLQMFGYNVLTAGDGAEGIALYAQHRDDVQLVITDMAMPILDGPAMIRVLRNLAPRLPIIITSGASADASLGRTPDLGSQPFLAKPYTAEQLLQAVHAALHPGV